MKVFEGYDLIAILIGNDKCTAIPNGEDEYTAIPNGEGRSRLRWDNLISNLKIIVGKIM